MAATNPAPKPPAAPNPAVPNPFPYSGNESESSKRKIRLQIIRKHPHILFYDQDRKNYMLFYTDNIVAWAKALWDNKLQRQQIRFSIYSNGTVMISCPVSRQDDTHQFITERFKLMKQQVEQKKMENPDAVMSAGCSLANLSLNKPEDKNPDEDKDPNEDKDPDEDEDPK
ncbi:unnamed protein product [Lota lota]